MRAQRQADRALPRGHVVLLRQTHITEVASLQRTARHLVQRMREATCIANMARGAFPNQETAECAVVCPITQRHLRTVHPNTGRDSTTAHNHTARRSLVAPNAAPLAHIRPYCPGSPLATQTKMVPGHAGQPQRGAILCRPAAATACRTPWRLPGLIALQSLSQRRQLPQAGSHCTTWWHCPPRLTGIQTGDGTSPAASCPPMQAST
mmetsp:Transcript_27560/g.77921  ORF Transcript_27560/g.77921 Transcript_27560/m.77921 type:complete len:207 (+) Transcript_27560:729-1349(+)